MLKRVHIGLCIIFASHLHKISASCANNAFDKDDPNYQFTLFHDNKTLVKCSWLTENDEQVYDRKATYCPYVELHCPISCGKSAVSSEYTDIYIYQLMEFAVNYVVIN